MDDGGVGAIVDGVLNIGAVCSTTTETVRNPDLQVTYIFRATLKDSLCTTDDACYECRRKCRTVAENRENHIDNHPTL